MATTDLDYLLPYLRLKIGDTDSTAYKYLDEWLQTALILAVKSLSRYWGSKYFVTDAGVVTRNADYEQFEFEESDGLIQSKDEDIIIIKAAIIILGGSLENSAWNLGSWRDAEIYYSNTESGRIRKDSVDRLQAELDSMIKAPMKRLTKGYRETLIEEV